jgi:hypothetical protein
VIENVLKGSLIHSSSKNRTFVDLIFFRFAIFPQMWQFADLRFADPVIKLLQKRKYILLTLTNISYKCFHSNLRTTFVFWDSVEFHGMLLSEMYLSRQRSYANADLD